MHHSSHFHSIGL